jgi:valyl-tRNA synthetase
VLAYQSEEQQDEPISPTTADRWILSRLAETTREATADLERFELSGAGQRVHDFIWSEFADWYLEIAKIRLFDDSDAEGRATARAVLWSVLERALRLLHPYMPFVTEEIWQSIRRTGSRQACELSGWSGDLPEYIMVAPWPESGDRDEAATVDMDLVVELIRRVRAVRSEYRVEPAKFVSSRISGGMSTRVIEESREIIGRLARLEIVEIAAAIDPPADSVALLVDTVTVYLPIDELADIACERERVSREIAGAHQALRGATAKIENAAFVSRAPQAVVDRERARAEDLAERVRRLEERLAALGTDS